MKKYKGHEDNQKGSVSEIAKSLMTVSNTKEGYNFRTFRNIKRRSKSLFRGYCNNYFEKCLDYGESNSVNSRKYNDEDYCTFEDSCTFGINFTLGNSCTFGSGCTFGDSCASEGFDKFSVDHMDRSDSIIW